MLQHIGWGDCWDTWIYSGSVVVFMVYMWNCCTVLAHCRHVNTSSQTPLTGQFSVTMLKWTEIVLKYFDYFCCNSILIFFVYDEAHVSVHVNTVPLITWLAWLLLPDSLLFWVLIDHVISVSFKLLCSLQISAGSKLGGSFAVASFHFELTIINAYWCCCVVCLFLMLATVQLHRQWFSQNTNRCTWFLKTCGVVFASTVWLKCLAHLIIKIHLWLYNNLKFCG